MKDNNELPKWIYGIGLIPTIWLALLISPSFNGGLPQIIKDFPKKMENPFSINWCNDSLKVICLFIIIYLIAIGIYLSTKRNYRRREEKGNRTKIEEIRIRKRIRINI